MDLQECVTENSERVQGLRDAAVVNYKVCSAVRKEKWDSKSKPREFQKGEQVLMRKSGMNLKLSESWLGPYTITKKKLTTVITGPKIEFHSGRHMEDI